MSFETFEKLPAEKKELILSTGIRAFSLQSYQDVRTDTITEQCGISKGILFHYFGSKKAFYRCCLEQAMSRLTENTAPVDGDDFYSILFEQMDQRMRICRKYSDEMHMVNTASRDTSREISGVRSEVFQSYAEHIQSVSAATMRNAVKHLKLKEDGAQQFALDGLLVYIRALISRYLLQYQETPDLFFENSGRIHTEMKAYLGLMLYGICEVTS